MPHIFFNLFPVSILQSTLSDLENNTRDSTKPFLNSVHKQPTSSEGGEERSRYEVLGCSLGLTRGMATSGGLIRDSLILQEMLFSK